MTPDASVEASSSSATIMRLPTFPAGRRLSREERDQEKIDRLIREAGELFRNPIPEPEEVEFQQPYRDIPIQRTSPEEEAAQRRASPEGQERLRLIQQASEEIRRLQQEAG